MGLAYVIIVIVCSSFTGRLVARPFGDGDLFWQGPLGAYVLAHHALPHALGNETFTVPGAPWTAQEWLLGIATHLAMASGKMWLLAVAADLALAGVLLLCAYRARGFGASGIAIALSVVLVAIDLEGSFGIRAQVFAWVPLAGLLASLDLTGASVFLAVAMVVIWANVHGSVALAIPLVWIDTAVAIAKRGWADADTRRRLVLAVLVPLATLATPLGIALPIFAWTLFRSPIRHWIDEWQPIAWSHSFFWIGAVPMLAVVLICLRTLWREHPRDLLWVAVLLVMTVEAARNAALLGIALAPLCARAIDVIMARFSWWPLELLRTRGLRAFAMTGAILASVLVLMISVRQPPPKDYWNPPLATFRYLAQMPGGRRIFCYDFAACSIALQYPNLRVFIDGRADAYPLWVWNDFNTIRFASRGWDARLLQDGANTVVVKKDDRLDRALRKRREWVALAPLDRCCRAYVLSGTVH